MIEQYKKDAYRTISILATTELNLSHMVLGMASELGELQQALENNDFINAGEELGDIMWYCANYSTLRGVDVVIQHDLDYYNFKHLITGVSELTDVVKKRIAYDKPIDKDVERQWLQYIINVCSAFYEKGWKPSIEEVMTKNINKLKTRYPEKYSNEKALNRDLDKEREALS